MPHTPGPWEIDTSHGIVVGPTRIRYGINGRTAAQVKEAFANARLVSAAPNMLQIIRGRNRLSNLSERLERLRQQFRKECEQQGIEQCPKLK